MFLRNLILIILAFYPFASQLVSLRFIYIGGKKLGALDFYGLFAVIIAIWGLIDFYLKKDRKIFNSYPVMGFIAFVILAGFSAFIEVEKSPVSILDVIISTGAPYIFYSFFFYYMDDEVFRLKFYKTIWLSSFFATAVTVFMFFGGIGKIDISQDVSRFAGFYGDAMTFSLVALISLAFGTLFYEKVRLSSFRYKKYFYFLIATYVIVILVLAITLTKISLIVAAFFTIAWFGFFKKKILLIAPAVFIAGIILFNESENIQKRFNAEVAVIKAYNVPYFSIYDARGFGSGRFRRWIDAYDLYTEDYNFSEQLFGTFNFYTMHNQYIGFLLLSGASGLLIFLFMLFRFLKRLALLYLYTRSPEYFMAITLLIIIIIIGFGYMSFTYTFFLWATFILVGLINLKPSTIHKMRISKLSANAEYINAPPASKNNL